MTEPTTPQLTEEAVREIEAIASSHRIDWRYPNFRQQVAALIQDWRALRARLTACESSRRVHELDNHHNALACGYCAGPIKEESTRLTAENAALREQLAEAQQIAETRSDIIAAKAAHIDQLQSQLAQVEKERDDAVRILHEVNLQ